jgi:hypothetical protein
MRITKAHMALTAPAVAGVISFSLATTASAATLPGNPLGAVLAKTTQSVVATTNVVTTQVGAALPLHVAAPAPATSRNSAPAAGAATASGTGLSVPMLGICVSCTSASSGSTQSAHATGLQVLGTTLTAGSSGPAAGAQSGSLLAIPANPVAAAAVADWYAFTTGTSAHSRAALADVALANGAIATLAVLRTESDTNNGHAHAITDGVDLNIARGALVVVLLHSESSASGGRTFVASINGLELLSSDQLVGGIPISLPGIATINLLLTSAGVSPTGVIAKVSNVLGTSGVLTSALEATSSAPAAHVVTESGGSTTGVQGATSTPVQAVTPAAPSAGAGVTTPMTGVGIGIAGLLLAGGGLALLAAARRRTHRTG